MLTDKDFFESYPVVHEDADLSKVHERLAWKWRMDRTPLLAPLANINWDAEAIKKLNASFHVRPIFLA